MESLGVNTIQVRYSTAAIIKPNPHVCHLGPQPAEEWKSSLPLMQGEIFDTWEIRIPVASLQTALDTDTPGVTIEVATQPMTQAGATDFWYVQPFDNWIQLRLLKKRILGDRLVLTLVGSGVQQIQSIT